MAATVTRNTVRGEEGAPRRDERRARTVQDRHGDVHTQWQIELASGCARMSIRLVDEQVALAS